MQQGSFTMKKLAVLTLVFLSSVYAQELSTSVIDNHLKSFVGAVSAQEEKSQTETELNALKKREIVSHLFFDNQYSPFNTLKSSVILNDNVLSDLNLISENRSDSLFAKINATSTVFGEMYLISLLSLPTTDPHVLQSNQVLVKKLVNNVNALEQLEAELRNIQTKEDAFLSLWLPDVESREKLFFKKGLFKKINNNAVATSVANNLLTFGEWSKAHLLELTQIIAANQFNVDEYTTLNIGKKIGSVTIDFVRYNVNPINLFWTPIKSIKKSYDAVDTSVDQMVAIYKQQNIQVSSDNIRRGMLFTIGAGAAFQSYSLYCKTQFYKKLLERKQIVDKLQEQLSEISSLIQSFESIKDIFERELGIYLPELQLTDDVRDLIHDLKTFTFKNKSTMYFEGRVLKCYHQIKQIKNQLAPLFVQMARVDAFVSMAKLYNSYVNSRTPFCFVEFLRSDKPVIQGAGFWNVMIDSNKVVVNDLIIDKNIVLTGPNAGGKSTTIKAFLQNILLAQTFGIAAASEFKLVPFSRISSYLNITDDLSHGKSLFKAEVERAQALLNTTNSLTTGEFGFCAIDELFTGTSAEAGEDCAYEFATKLATKNNSVFIFATHYQKLTELEDLSKQFANYRVGLPQKINGKLRYPFTLEKGVNTVNIARDILQEAQLI